MIATIVIDPSDEIAMHGQSIAVGNLALLLPTDPAACVGVADRLAAALGEVRGRAALRLANRNGGLNRIVTASAARDDESTAGDEVTAWRRYEHDEELHSGRSFIAPPFIVGCRRCDSEYGWRLRNGMPLAGDAQAAS